MPPAFSHHNQPTRTPRPDPNGRSFVSENRLSTNYFLIKIELDDIEVQDKQRRGINPVPVNEVVTNTEACIRMSVRRTPGPRNEICLRMYSKR